MCKKKLQCKYFTTYKEYASFSMRRDRDRQVVGFTTTCAISTYHH
jgi:hypothetical protein